MVPRKKAKMSRRSNGRPRILPDQNSLSFSSPGMTMSFHVLNCSESARSPSGVMKMLFFMFFFQSCVGGADKLLP